MSQSSISYLWREPEAAKGFTTGVSLHSHTNQSKETLDFISELSKDWKTYWIKKRLEDDHSSAAAWLPWFRGEDNEENLVGLAALNRELIARAEAIASPQRVVLDMDSTEIPVYGEQEQSRSATGAGQRGGLPRRRRLCQAGAVRSAGRT